MDLAIEPHTTDDPALLGQVSALIHGISQTNAFDHLAIVRIENWFDEKWAGFTGVVRNYHEDFGPNTYDVHRLSRALPPFARSRVVSLSVFGASAGRLPAVFFLSTNNTANARAALLGSIPILDGTDSWEWYVGYKLSDGWKGIRYWNINRGETERYASQAPNKSFKADAVNGAA